MSNLGSYRPSLPGAVGQPTSRDKLELLLGYLRRAFRYWWLVAAVLIIGGVLSVLFAVTRKPLYQSSSVLFYHERIMASLRRFAEGKTVEGSYPYATRPDHKDP